MATQDTQMIAAVATVIAANQAMRPSSVTFAGTDAGDENQWQACQLAGLPSDIKRRKARRLVNNALRIMRKVGLQRFIVPTTAPGGRTTYGDARWSYGYKFGPSVLANHLRRRPGLQAMAEERHLADCDAHRERDCIACLIREWSAQ